MTTRRSTPVPDFIKMGIMKRKLKRQEARAITNEIMRMNINDPQIRFTLAVIRAIDMVNK